ncbi:MAG: 30S ribosomal protein S4 [Candidatus Omnitrophica bacterium]|nr:30S ribosomal protein S4 [Candidatus Omnitrophota bacterium]MDD5671531.1 30S ribosomal protein S4 [Candidatus Omnitrophota bacterium]
MGKYIGPAIRLSRREGVNLYIKGSRRSDDKVAKRLEQPPGMHGHMRKKLSDYGLQLREKQKMKRIYGLLERQFRVMFRRAVREKGVTGEKLIQLLERRLDNTVYRLLFTQTRREARQMVNHGLICVNGHPLNIPSYLVKIGDVIEPKKKEANLNRVKAKLEASEDIPVPEWLLLDRKTLQGKIIRYPAKADAGLPVEESLIVELYSK